MKNYFILCPSFHGATLLSLLLSNHGQIVSLGDTLPTSKFDQGCGCGKRVSDCEFWASIQKRHSGAGIHHLQQEYCILSDGRWLNIALLCCLYLSQVRISCPEFTMGYHALTDAAHCWKNSATIFVDGFKSISRYISCRISNVDVSGAIQLIRDPRAFCLSMKKAGVPVREAAKSWCDYYRAIDLLAVRPGHRMISIKYEDLCADPHGALGKILSFMDLTGDDLLRPVDAGAHWIGNASLVNFDGNVTNENTGKWRHGLSREEIMLIQNIAGRRMERYGYEMSA